MMMAAHKSCLAATDIWCGKKRCALWQGKMSLLTRRDLCCGKTQGRRPSAASTKGGGRLRRPPPFVVPLCLATTEVSSCHDRHLVLPQRTSFLAAPDIRRGKTRFVCRHHHSTCTIHPHACIIHDASCITYRRHVSFRCFSVITRRWWLRSGHLWGQNEL